MKTTLMLDDVLYSRVRVAAATRNTSISALVSEALCEFLAKRDSAPAAPLNLTVFSGKGEGFIAPVDPHSNTQLEEFMDEGRPLEKLR